MRIAVVDQSGLVRDVIIGVLSDDLVTPFTDHFTRVYGAVTLVQVPEDATAWIGGTYSSGEFTPPAEDTE